MACRHRRQAAHAQVPEQRAPRPLGVTDAQTQVEHFLSEESVAEHRHAGRYLALCGVHVLAASLTASPRAHCGPCVRAAAS